MKKVYLVYCMRNWNVYTSWDLLKAFSRKYVAEQFITDHATSTGTNLCNYRLEGIKVDESKWSVGNHDLILD